MFLRYCYYVLLKYPLLNKYYYIYYIYYIYFIIYNYLLYIGIF